jgi:hypothetical protein
VALTPLADDRHLVVVDPMPTASELRERTPGRCDYASAYRVQAMTFRLSALRLAIGIEALTAARITLVGYR